MDETEIWAARLKEKIETRYAQLEAERMERGRVANERCALWEEFKQELEHHTDVLNKAVDRGTLLLYQENSAPFFSGSVILMKSPTSTVEFSFRGSFSTLNLVRITGQTVNYTAVHIDGRARWVLAGAIEDNPVQISSAEIVQNILTEVVDFI
jgi:hypothetical protein